MASGASRSTAFGLLFINLLLYLVITGIAAWVINHGIEWSHETAHLSPTARLFPIYFPIGNMATGFFVVFSLISGVIGMITSTTGIHNITQISAMNPYTVAGSSLVALSLTLLSLGLACKEIHLGHTEENLRILEVTTIIVSVTQLLCTGAIHDEMRRAPILIR
ncbi:hypothetical protein MLD38_039661 [Melastoma candidum]|uniref:Uncharacterized protein n=1 Tax=Melastoma candidum TaxID=119954 RepID=A0ACB9L2R3_9MYRT|nr:hypothetical protein MLD38_039661 [Melastoma candidum]